MSQNYKCAKVRKFGHTYAMVEIKEPFNLSKSVRRKKIRAERVCYRNCNDVVADKKDSDPLISSCDIKRP